ncbi:hypothetical protein V8E54_008146 [Elaphomyces granulatus]
MEGRLETKFQHLLEIERERWSNELSDKLKEERERWSNELSDKRKEERERLSDKRKEERERLSDKLKEVEEKWRQSNVESKQRWHDIRKATLDQWSSQGSKYALERLERNDSVHGGSLRSDMEVISSFSDSDLNSNRVARWKGAVKEMYGLSYKDLRPKINDIPDKVLLACNRRASACSLFIWETRKKNAHSEFWKDRRDKIVKNADTISQEWCQKPKDPDLFKEESSAQTSFTDIEKEWDRMVQGPSDQ